MNGVLGSSRELVEVEPDLLHLLTEGVGEGRGAVEEVKEWPRLAGEGHVHVCVLPVACCVLRVACVCVCVRVC